MRRSDSGTASSPRVDECRLLHLREEGGGERKGEREREEGGGEEREGGGERERERERELKRERERNDQHVLHT